MGPIAALEVQIAAQHRAFWHRNPAK
jgi:hypothetical protein